MFWVPTEQRLDTTPQWRDQAAMVGLARAHLPESFEFCLMLPMHSILEAVNRETSAMPDCKVSSHLKIAIALVTSISFL